MMRLTRVVTIIRYIPLLLLPAVHLCAAPTGTLTGYIKDPSGAFVRSASVTAVNRENGLRRSTRSGNEGAFFLPLLQPGEWRIEVEAAGFERATVPATRV